MADDNVSRRVFLGTVGAGVTALSGCTEGEGAGATETDTDAETATQTETATPSPAPVQHELTLHAPEWARKDERTGIRIEGAPPESEVTLSVQSTDGEGLTWTSETTFEAGEHGAVDVAGQAPIDGPYEGADPMGWLWAMTAYGEAEYAHRSQATFKLTVETDGDQTMRRIRRAEGATHERISSEVAGHFYVPSGEGPFPGVLLLHGTARESVRDAASLLATRGYATLALRWLGGDDVTPSSSPTEVPLEYFDEAASWMRDRDAVSEGPLGLWGVGKGAEAALLLGAEYEWPAAVIANAPSTVVTFGDEPGTSSWTLDGDPVPHLPRPENVDELRSGEDGLAHWRSVYETALDEASDEQVLSAAIDVAAIDAPTLFVSGRDDEYWPATELSERAVRTLDDAGVDYRYDHLAYEQAGHMIPEPYQPTAGLSADNSTAFGGKPEGIARAAADHWPTVIDYLADGLDL